MKKIILILALFFTQSCLIGAGTNSQVGVNKNGDKYFPQVSGIDLQGNIRQLPSAFENKLNLVIVAFKRNQQQEVETWIEGAKPILAQNKNINFYELPVIYEVSMLKRAWVNNAMRLGVKGDEARSHTITIYTNRDEFFKITNTKEDEISAFLVDNSGKILWRANGVASKEALGSLANFIAK